MRHKGQGDVTKLPVWAQDRILLLERNLEYANAKIAELSNMQTGGVVTQTYVDGGHRNPKIYLPNDSEVTFEGDGHNEISLKRTFDFQKNADSKTGFTLRSNGQDYMAILPECTNVFKIIFIDRAGKIVP